MGTSDWTTRSVTTTTNLMEFIKRHHNRSFTKNELENINLSPASVDRSLLQAPKNEYLVQRLWFEGWFRPEMTTTRSEKISIIQTGFWNHGAGPDFTYAAYRNALGKIHVGAVEVHLDARDWYRHGHDQDPLYNDVLLHLVWNSHARPTLTQSGKTIPQIEIGKFIPLSIQDLESIDFETPRSQSTLARPGLCQKSLLSESSENRQSLIEEAGWLRLLHKAHRLRLRQRAVGRTQALWEYLGEACGYAKNRLGFRALTQRVRAQDLIGLSSRNRKAILFGVASFLPDESHFTHDQSPLLREESRSIWECWWRPQSEWALSVLPRRTWNLYAVRPWNRPERRFAALARLIPFLPPLLQSLEKGDRSAFLSIFKNLQDRFWETHSTWNSAPHPPVPLLGSERLLDLEINLFAVWQIMLHGESAKSILETMKMTPNQKTKLAWARVGTGDSFHGKETSLLFQQGLMHLLQEFCYQDHSNCTQCLYPQIIKTNRLQENAQDLLYSYDSYFNYIQIQINRFCNGIRNFKVRV